MKKFVCTICGYIHEGDAPPYICPVCKVSSDKFNEIKDDNNSIFRNFIITDKIKENDLITSFYLEPIDRMTLRHHLAGQFISVKPINSGVNENEVRQYSLSMKPGKDFYRISIKRENNGLISNYMHDNVNVNDMIQISNPLGEFTLKDNSNPIVLIGGGIGITPVMSMLYEAAEAGRDVIFVQASLNSSLHTFKDEVNFLSQKYKSIKSYIFYDSPLNSDKLGVDYTNTGFITQEWMETTFPKNADFYFCGPPGLMKHLETSLNNIEVKDSQINYELFSPVKK